LKVVQATVLKAGTRFALALFVLSMILFLPAARAGSTITLTSPNALAGGHFGESVSVSGTTVVVGAPDESAGGQDSAGNAYVFDATDGSFITELTSPTPQAGGEFGFSVSISGTTVVVGAPGEMVGPLLQAGHAYVLDASTGASITTLTSPYAQAYGHFGYSVAVGSTTVVVGAPDETAGGQLGAGHTYTFDATTGFMITTLTSPNPQEGGFFGGSVAVTEDDPIVVVGAAGESGGGYPIAGHAYIFF